MQRALSSLAVLAVLVIGCGQRAGLQAVDAAVDAVAGPQAVDSGAGAMDAGCVHPNQPGVPVCCGLPGQRPGSNCIPWATLDRCSKAGEFFDAKALKYCCPGLQTISHSVPVAEPSADGGTCKEIGHDGFTTVYICAACADGTCGPGENRCNCPQDCK